MKKWLLRGLVIIFVVAGGAWGAAVFVRSLSRETTDDAYVSGTIVPVSAEIKGRVVKVHIRDNQYVAAGTPIIEILPDDYVDVFSERKESKAVLEAQDREMRASVEEKRKEHVQAQANLDAARAEEALADKDMKRYADLLKQGAVSQSQFDTILARFNVTKARTEASGAAVAAAGAATEALEARQKTQEIKIKEAQTHLNMAQLDVTRTVVTAPDSGWIAMKNVDPGKYVQPGQPLLSIVEKNTWVIANFKETQIKKMTVGQSVRIKADAYPAVVFSGHVDSIQPGTGAVFSLLPPENATGNFVKVVQRVPVKIVIDSPFDAAHPLLPGLSVYPEVDVSRPAGPKLTTK
jgi:membrane fusion protein (multidrug efflux system)